MSPVQRCSMMPSVMLVILAGCLRLAHARTLLQALPTTPDTAYPLGPLSGSSCDGSQRLGLAIPAGTIPAVDGYSECGPSYGGVWFTVGPFPGLTRPVDLVVDTIVNGACPPDLDTVLSAFENVNGGVGRCAAYDDDGSRVGLCSKMRVRVTDPSQQFFIRLSRFYNLEPFPVATELHAYLDCNTEAPVCESVTLTQRYAPPNGKLATFVLDSVTDADGPALRARITSIMVSEAPNQRKAAACPLANYSAEWQPVPFTFQLRADRNTGPGAVGRTYYVQYEANDGGVLNPRTCTGRVTVCMPRNAGSPPDNGVHCGRPEKCGYVDYEERLDVAQLCAA